MQLCGWWRLWRSHRPEPPFGRANARCRASLREELDHAPDAGSSRMRLRVDAPVAASVDADDCHVLVELVVAVDPPAAEEPKRPVYLIDESAAWLAEERAGCADLLGQPCAVPSAF